MGCREPDVLQRVTMSMALSPGPALMKDIDLGAFVTDDSRAWIDHWSSLRREAIVPLRSALDPMAMPRLLPHMLICDLSEPGIVRIRLMGTGMVTSFGFDPTGHDYLDLVDPARREEAYAGFAVPAGQPCGMRVLGENRYESGLTLAVETVGFPFRRDDGAGMQMVFVGTRVGAPTIARPDLGPSISFHVFERQFIDIGAGVP